MGTGPIPASRLCLKKAGWEVNDLDLLEINEMDEEAAAALIMKARAHWFEAEQQA